VVLFAVGFETTACTTAAAIAAGAPDNFSLLVSHRLIPPAMEALLQIEGLQTQGFLLPGHVITVSGTLDYRPIATLARCPMVVAGFEPVDIILGLERLAALALKGEARVDNTYRRVVQERGNPQAIRVMAEVYQPADAAWRGLGIIPRSGLELRPQFAHHDAIRRFGLTPDLTLAEAMPGCDCGRVMVGLRQPEDCPLFAKVCNPDTPRGPCMVSFEGTCRNRYLYQGA
jgi:hydrogenase expression/formation protein HypD